MSPRGTRRPVRGAFRAALCVAVLTVGCGGRTSGPNPSAASGTVASGGSGAVMGSGSGGAGVTSGGATGGTGLANSDGGDASGGSTSGCDPNLCSCQLLPYCDPQCPSGQHQCFNGPWSCKDLQTDRLNCGACYRTCSQVQSCQNGICVPITDASADASDDGSVAAVEADAGTPPSCATGGPGMTNCGPGGSGTESCCTSLEVTGGTYYRTYTNDGAGPTGEADPATVGSFRLDKYEVTVGRFRQFVNAWNGGAGWLPPAGSGKHAHLNAGKGLANSNNLDGTGTYEQGWVGTDNVWIEPTNASLGSCPPYGTWMNSPDGNENLPINCLVWHEAYAFCIWDGGFLPSEGEWEYAAAGGSQQREYPWGSADPGNGNQYAIYDCYYPSGTSNCFGVQNIASVGSAKLGAGLWGQLDLAGNVWEWNLDSSDPYVDPCADCADLPAGAQYATALREARGGSFGFSIVLPPNRAQVGILRRNYDDAGGGYETAYRSHHYGFRCARTP